MEIDKEFIKLRISQFEQGAKKLHDETIYNQGAADGLKKLLAELEELEKQTPITVDELVKNSQYIEGKQTNV